MVGTKFLHFQGWLGYIYSLRLLIESMLLSLLSLIFKKLYIYSIVVLTHFI